MTKISKTSAYPLKVPVKGDYFVGTDSESNGKTVNFSFEDTVALINSYNGTHIIDYKFRTDINIPLTVLTDGIFLSENNETSVDSLTKLYINKNNIHEESKAELFQFIKNYNTSFYFRIQDSQDLNKLAYFNVDSIVDNTSHFIFNVAIDKRTQSISQLVDYKIYFISFETKAKATRTSELINDGEGLGSNFTTGEYVDNADNVLDNRLTILETAQSQNTNFTSILKGYYDGAVTWITTNGSNLLSHLTDTNNPHGITKSQVGLGNVDNTSDIEKPISTATQIVLDTKATNIDLALKADKSITVNGQPLSANVIITKSDIGLGNVDNTADLDKPVSTAQAIADNAILTSANSYSDGLITQLINGAPADANTLKELNDKILAVQAIIGSSSADGDTVVNTVSELLAVFATFPEGIDLVTLLAGKVNVTDIYNALDCIIAGKVLDARQGKVLNDAITAINVSLALKANNSEVVHLSGDETITGLKTFSGALTAGSFVKSGGTASQFLKADGSVDSNTYLTSAVTTFSAGTTGLTPSTATSGAITLNGTLVVANGGTGSTTASGARTNLGATTIGSNIFTATNPSAVTFLRANADNTISWLDAVSFRTAIGAGTSTVTPSALTKVDDTNVTLTLGGTPATSLLQGVSLTLGWTGTLADSRIASAANWNAKQNAIGYTPANDANVVHTTGDETKVGILTLSDGLNLGDIVANSTQGFVTKSGQPFIHNFYAGNNPPSGGVGKNLNIGYNSGNFNSDNFSYASTMVGFESGLSNKNGYSNTGIGYHALRLNQNGFGNTALGTFVLGNAINGDQNTSVGWHSMLYRTGGSANSGFGVDVLKENLTGSFNTAFGTNAGANNVVGDLNVFLGYAAGFDELGSSKLYISNSSTSNPLIKGDFNTNSLALGAGVSNKLYIYGTGSIIKIDHKTHSDTLIPVIYDATGYTFNLNSSGSFTVNSTGVAVGLVSGNINKFEVLTNSSTGGSSSNGMAVHDGQIQRMAILSGVNTASSYSWLQSVKGGVGPRPLFLNPNGGGVSIGNTTDPGSNNLSVTGTILSSQYRLSALNTAPATATSTGTLGEIRVTATYIYVCTATNTWVRTALATW